MTYRSNTKDLPLIRVARFFLFFVYKASVSPYVDGIFEVMFKMPSKIPLPVKHLFDTFDELAVKYAGGGSPEACAESWKRNW